MPRKGQRLDAKRDQKALVLHEQGFRLREIAKLLGWKNEQGAWAAVHRAKLDAAREADTVTVGR